VVTSVIAQPRAHAQARARIGDAVIIQNEVLRVAGSATSQINVGDGVLRDETVRTRTESAARFVMVDSTNLSLGPMRPCGSTAASSTTSIPIARSRSA
jgi:hypothetical protein